MLPEVDDLVGTMLGKDHRVLKQIGAGGMAVVYLVEHQTLLKQFAAKVLSSELASSLEARARFAQEAHAASQLDHENIVSITDFGVTVDHRPYFVMELLRGQTLDRRLAEGPMSLEEVVAVSVPVARALAHAHAEGVIHLDVKPENIFLVQRSQGRWGVKVVDFGIARTPQNPRVTNPGEAVGTPAFMAPEVCCGADDVDQRADIYSFGILLYLMMCGRLPFVDDSLVRVLQMQLVQLPPPPREINAELSPELAAVVERALAKQPEDRYPSMQALLRDLDAALPPGADRLLIEAQSGTALRDTPFPRAITPFPRAASNPRLESQPARPSAPHEAQAMPASHPVPPSGPVSTHPPAPAHPPRLAIIIPTAVVVIALAGAVGWRQLAAPRAVATNSLDGISVNAAAHETGAGSPSGASVAAVAPAGDPVATAAAGRGARAEDTPGAAAGAAAPDAVADPTGPTGAAGPTDPADGDMAATVERSAMMSNKLAVRPGVQRDVPRPGRRTASVIAAAHAASLRRKAGAAGAIGSVAPSESGTVGQAAAGASSPVTGPDAGSATGSAVETPLQVAVAAPPAAPEPVPAAASATALPAAPVVLPASPPAPAALAAPAPIKPSPGTLDAVPTVTTLDVKGSLSPSIVRRSVERTLGSLRGCYRTAARAGGATPTLELQLRFEIDENGLATQVATGGAQFGSLGACAVGVASKIRTPTAPDVGTAQVTVGIRFIPS